MEKQIDPQRDVSQAGSIPFNQPWLSGNESKYVQLAIEQRKLAGDRHFTKACHKWLQENLFAKRALLTTSGTHGLELAALLANIQPGDEVILPSFTFSSTANAFALRGAKLVFVDIRPDTLNIDEKQIESAITPATRVIVPVHYAGVGCDMKTIMDIAKKHHLLVIEDAAQAIMATYAGEFLGTIGHMGCLSFHETKNLTCGEGGALLVKESNFAARAEVIREKGTNRSQFLRGQVDKYTWVDIGSSYLPADMNAAFLLAQLEAAREITEKRLHAWRHYQSILVSLASEGFIELPFIPSDCSHNAHMFYVKTKDIEERTQLIGYLKEHGVSSAFHYVPLHSSVAGLKMGRFFGEDKWTTRESERLLRLPFFTDISADQIEYVCKTIAVFYAQRS